MTGPERFDRYVERCLYGPAGFYAIEGTAGRRSGDFITSPEVGPLFGAVLAGAIDAWWAGAGRPEPFTIYDVGCGPGSLLKAIGLAADELGRPWRLVGVDRVPAAGAERTTLPDDLSASVVVANELLDNLPFRIVERRPSGELAEVFVDAGAEQLQPVELAPDHPAGRIAPGRRAPLLEQAAAWVADALDRRPVAVCAFDYGAPTTAALADRGGWLRTYQAHRRGDDPLVHPGRLDITTDIAWDQLPPPAQLTTQAEFLRTWGIDELVEAGRRYWTEHAAAPDLTALRMRSRIPEAEALLDPDGLGGWWVAVWRP